MNIMRWRELPAMRASDGPPLFEPKFETRLRLRPGEKIFAVGSCFARNIERVIEHRFDVVSRPPPDSFPRPLAEADAVTAATFWHRYNAFSIRNSLAWSLAGGPNVDRLIELEPGQYVDAYTGCRLPLRLETARELYRWTDSIFARAFHSRIVIVTLGLAEVWHDNASGIFMNIPPSLPMWTKYPGRFSHRVTGASETLQQLEEISTILRTHGPADQQIIVSVSPIPLNATFREVDVAVANAASKAILRAAVEEWVARHPHIHYFPSYEIVLCSDPRRVWTEDFRHVTPEIIGHIGKLFLRKFAGAEAGAGASKT